MVKNAEASKDLGKLAIQTLKDDDKLIQLAGNIQKFATYDSAAVIAAEVLKLVK